VSTAKVPKGPAGEPAQGVALPKAISPEQMESMRKMAAASAAASVAAMKKQRRLEAAVPLPTVNDDSGPIRLSKLSLDQLKEPLFIKRYREFYVGLSEPAAQREISVHEAAHHLGFKLTGAKNITYEKAELFYDEKLKDYVGHAGKVNAPISTTDIPEGMPLAEWMMLVTMALAAGTVAAEAICGSAKLGSGDGDLFVFNNFCDALGFEKLYPGVTRASYWANAQENMRITLMNPVNQAATLQVADEMQPEMFGLFSLPKDSTTHC
jgi:hypothetical protein